MVVLSYASCGRDGHGAGRGRVWVKVPPPKGRELAFMTRQLVWSMNKSLCTLNQHGSRTIQLCLYTPNVTSDHMRILNKNLCASSESKCIVIIFHRIDYRNGFASLGEQP